MTAPDVDLLEEGKQIIYSRIKENSLKYIMKMNLKHTIMVNLIELIERK
jgi:hypothetical protein